VDKFIINIFSKLIMILIIFTFCYVLKLVINLMFTCPVLILLRAWLTLIFQCEYSAFYSLLSIGYTALWIVFFSSSDHRYLWTVPYGASDCPPPLFFNINFFSCTQHSVTFYVSLYWSPRESKIDLRLGWQSVLGTDCRG
jgi:hypothetical protein